MKIFLIALIILTNVILIHPLKNISAFKLLSDEALNVIDPYLKLVQYPKGTILIKADKVESVFYMIESGIARAYSDGENQQITFWFGQKNDILFSYNSYINDAPGYENIELLDNCILYQIKIADLKVLYQSSLEIANWGRKIIEQELIATEKRLIDRLFKTATERYRDFIKQQPELNKKVALKHIASYLGVTQVTLSRIRSEYK